MNYTKEEVGSALDGLLSKASFALSKTSLIDLRLAPADFKTRSSESNSLFRLLIFRFAKI